MRAEAVCCQGLPRPSRLVGPPVPPRPAEPSDGRRAVEKAGVSGLLGASRWKHRIEIEAAEVEEDGLRCAEDPPRRPSKLLSTKSRRVKPTLVLSINVSADSMSVTLIVKRWTIHTRLDIFLTRSTRNSHIATANFASNCGSKASPSDNDRLSHARTIKASSPAQTDVARGSGRGTILRRGRLRGRRWR
jgi:hypothetical protein